MLNILREFDGVSAIALAKGRRPTKTLLRSPKILLPSTGAEYSQRAAEVAIALARGGNGTVTAFHVQPPASELDILRRPSELKSAGQKILKNIEDMGQRSDVAVKRLTRARRDPDRAILREIERGEYDLVVVGVQLRPGKTAFFGRRPAALAERSTRPLLLVNS